MALFGTNGVRGTIDVLNPSLAYDLSISFAAFIFSHRRNARISFQKNSKIKVMLARDMRITSPMLHASVKAGLLSFGADVFDIGLVSSPVAEFMLEKQGADGLIIVTASHNPPEWNALKFVDSQGIAVSRERGEEIEKMALEKTYAIADWKNTGLLTEFKDASDFHARSVLNSLHDEKIKKAKLRIALDFGNGTSLLSCQVFERLGCEIIALNDKLDGHFPGRPSEPAQANLQQLMKSVTKNSADFGVAWDGDSDRVIFVDEKGNFIVGDKGFAVSANRACEEENKRDGCHGKYVVTTVATSRAVEEACAKFGAKTVYTKVGAPYLSMEMAKLGKKAISGGEEVGGIIWPRFSLAKDGIFAAAKVAEMVASGQTLSSLVEALPLYYNSKCKISDVSPDEKEVGLLSAKKHALSLGPSVRVNLVDGVRADFEDGWVIVRASGTENAMRVFAEGKTKKRADALMAEFQCELNNAIK